MPAFQYTALRSGGRKVSGTVEATDSSAAAAVLREQGNFILELNANRTAAARAAEGATEANGTGGVDITLRGLMPIRARDTVFVFQQLALMLRSGLTLLQSLQVCRDQCSHPRLARVLERLANAVRTGSSLSQAMGAEGRVFSQVAVQLVRTAEATGELDTTLERIAEQLDRKLDLQNSLLTSLVYPTIVMLSAIGVVIFLAVYAIPRFQRFLANRNVALPATTQAMMDVVGFLRDNGIAVLAGAGAVSGIVLAVYLTATGRRRFHALFLRLPVVGKLLTSAAMAQLGRTLSALLRSGVTVLEGLRIVKDSTGNRALAAHLEGAADRVLRGQTVSQALRGRLVPRLVSEVVHTGEMSGSLDTVCDELGSYYTRDLEKRIRRLTALFEPAMILVVGGIVGFVYFSFFQVLFQLSAR
jgi:type IV pilus assembly protein PilC